MNTPKVSVIIAFYNKIDFLKLVLAGFSRQDFSSFEVIIADDGSNAEVVNEINSLKENYTFPIHHCWHEDQGWRKNMILNKAVKLAAGSYLIFIDGDCVPHRCFVKEHYQNREEGKFLAGRRVHLSPRICKKLSSENVKKGILEPSLQYFIDSLKRRPRTKNAEKSIFVNSPFLRRYFNRKPKMLLGCNMSMFRADLLTINGFDERYLHAGTGEDVDVNVRAENAGFKIKSIQNMAVQYHLWHIHNNTSGHKENIKILEENKQHSISATTYSIFAEKDYT